MLRALRHGAWRLAYRSVGRLSGGVRIGLAHGFDSGQFMAYAYANEPTGALGVGRWIDRRLLGSLTCTSFRETSRLATEALRELLDERAGRETVVVDLAAGPARYLLDLLAERPRPEVRVLLRDIDGAGLQATLDAATARGLERIDGAVGDALDPVSLATVAREPDIAVELGLYGMFPDEVIAAHLRDLAMSLAPQALVASLQVHNPEIAHIAGVWPSRAGGRCEWRLRPPDLLLAWANDAGFTLEGLRWTTGGVYCVLTLRLAEAHHRGPRALRAGEHGQ